MDQNDRAVSLAARIADGSAIDWPAADSATATPADRALLDQLRAIADVATVHRAPGDDGDPRAPATWGSLTILSSVGKGRFGEVFVAWDARLHRRVALKLLHASSSSLSSPTRAIDEARLLARVRHPNVLTVHGAEYIGDTVGIWTEFIEGRTLEQMVAERRQLDPDEALAIGADLALALAAVHDAGLLHRDIKAQNVMRETGGRIVLMDFGAGHDLELAPARDGDYTGTPLYLSPEVLAGAAASRASDIYALGVLLFHLLTGTHPVTGRTLEDVRAAHRDRRVIRLGDARPDVPLGLQEVIDRSLAADPAHRFETAHAFSVALASASKPPAVRPRWATPQLVTGGLLSAAALVVLGWLGLPLLRSGPRTTGGDTISRPAESAPPRSELAPKQITAEPTADGMVNLEVWKGAGVHADGTASEDGRFLSATNGEGDILVRDLLTKKNVVVDKGDLSSQPIRHALWDGNALSRDGRRVAYAWCDGCDNQTQPVQLRVASAGQKPVTLVADADLSWIVPYDWSPDGGHIAVAFGRRARTVHVGLVSAKTGQLRDLKAVDWRGPTRMVFSRDGRFLVYDVAGTSSASRDVYVMELRTGRASGVVVEQPSHDTLAGWSPDGSTLLFMSDRSGALGVWGVAVADGKPIDRPRLLKPDLGSRAFALSVTTSGTLIYGIQASSQNVHVATVDFTSGRLLSPPAEAAEHYQTRNSGPDWSPDGRLVVVSDRPGNVTALSILPANRRDPVRELYPALETLQRPRWAPDGSITVQGQDHSGARGFFRVDAQSGNTTPLLVCASGALCQQASWTPDGQMLVYRRGTPAAFEVVARTTRTMMENVLAAIKRGPRIMIDGVSVSPDGTTVTYITHDGPTATLYLIPIAGGDPHELASAVLPNQLSNVAEWTPDGTHVIIHRSSSEGEGALWSVPIDGGPEVELKGIRPRLGTNTIRVHPDGRRVAFSAGELRYSVWTLANFLTAQ